MLISKKKLEPDKKYLILRCVVPTGINTYDVFYRSLPDDYDEKAAAIRDAEKCCKVYRAAKGFNSEIFKKKYPNVQQVHYSTGEEFAELFRNNGKPDRDLIKKTDDFFSLAE